MRVGFLFFVLLFSACSFKSYQTSESYLITLKTPQIKFSDIGYLRKDKASVQIELYASGVSVNKFEINHYVCSNDGCLSKNAFNDDYLSEYYPDELLKNVLMAKPIFNAQNLIRTAGGFEQRIEDENLYIIYKITANDIYFKDKKNGILIKLKQLK